MKIAVALSGGVDSATALYLLKKAGHDVFGLFMKNWEEEQDGACIAEKDADDARAVCTALHMSTVLCVGTGAVAVTGTGARTAGAGRFGRLGDQWERTWTALGGYLKSI